MDLYTPSKEKSLHVELPSLMDLYPDEPVKSIAVLFTDLVGSTKYFKEYGDKAGRTMLQEHYEIATPIINEYGGKLIKALGDSVMASFVNPLEAFKSAIKMQQQFQIYNQGKDTQDRVHVRIGLHYGNVIVEEKDIYGDVVNVASKLTNMSEGGQIYISREVYEHVKHSPSVHFESAKILHKNNIPKDLIAYKVIWDGEIELNPAVYTMLYLRPLWRLCEYDFKEIWNNQIETNNFLWDGQCIRKQVLTDRSVMLTMKESASTFIVAEKISEFLKETLLERNFEGKEDLLLPVQLIIDIDPLSTGYNLKTPEENNDWGDISPGRIHISSDAYEIIKRYIDIPGRLIERKLADRVFYQIITGDNRQEGYSLLSFCKKKMAHGEFPTCYYCGDKKHRPVDCPSKILPELTDGLEKLGYLSVEDIGTLFFKYLLIEKGDLDVFQLGGIKDPQPIISAHHGFFELKRIFQLRFFRTIWDTHEEEWEKIKKNRSEHDGGIIWLAQDLLRVSDLDRAESVLKNALEGNPTDYKVYCALGYLNMEKGRPLQTEQNFEKALQCAGSNPQKIFTLFLLLRFYMLNKDYDNARKKIRSILLLHPGCMDALYQDAIIKLSEGQDKAAIQILTKLIRKNRVYFIYTLIDPDLATYSNTINPQLLKLYETARENAKSIFSRAETELEKSRKILDADGVAEAESFLLKASNALNSGNYFSYLDSFNYSDSAISICANRIREQKKIILENLYQMSSRVEKGIYFVKSYRYKRLIRLCRAQLNQIKKNIYQAHDITKSATGEQFEALESFCDKIAAKLINIELNLRKYDSIQLVLIYLTKFLKKSAILLSIVLLIGIFAVPSIISGILKNNTVAADNIWFYQKYFLIAGSIVSIVISLGITIKNIMQDD
jgi:class 3 adenylate cyclase